MTKALIRLLLRRSASKAGAVIILAMLFASMVVSVWPVEAQVPHPDGVFNIQSVEAYQNVLELGDQLYLVTLNASYTTPPTQSIADTYIVRLMNGATELGTTTINPYHNNGYDYGIASIYFTAASAPAWSGAYTMKLDGNPTIHWLDATATTSMSGALALDTPVYTTETAASNSAAANDMTILPAAPAVGDAYYFGSTSMFNKLTVNVGTNGAWTGTYAWEYWGGSSWKAVSGLTDGTTGFTAGTGERTVSFTAPTDWQTTTVNALTYYWLRFRVVTFTAIVTQPLGTQSWVNASATVPTTSNNAFTWHPDTTLAATSDRLTIRLRALAQLIENDWGVDLIEQIAGIGKLTSGGEAYFTASVASLRDICPDLFADVVTQPNFQENAFIRDYYMGGDDAQSSVFGVNWYAQTFTTTIGYSINGVEFKALRTGNPGTVTASIRAVAGGVPNGADLTSGTLAGNDFTTVTGGKWEHVSFTSDYALANATTYAIVIRATAGDAANYVSLRYRVTATYSGGQACSSANSGGAWGPIAGSDYMFTNHATDAFSMSYRDKLAARLIGTRLDMTNLATNLNMSRMWMSSLVWLLLPCMFVAYWVCRMTDSFKPATFVFAIMLPIGAYAGFIYLEVAIIMAFLCAGAAIYVYAYRGAQ